MTKQIIGIGTVPNDGSGDTIRAAFTKVNSNFTELYTGNINLKTNSYGPGGTSLDQVALVLSNVVHKLTSGWYSLADGIEGQICYFVLDNAATDADTIIVKFAHARWKTPEQIFKLPNYSNVFLGTDASIITVIFTDGAWQMTPDGAWD